MTKRAAGSFTVGCVQIVPQNTLFFAGMEREARLVVTIGHYEITVHQPLDRVQSDVSRLAPTDLFFVRTTLFSVSFFQMRTVRRQR